MPDNFSCLACGSQFNARFSVCESCTSLETCVRAEDAHAPISSVHKVPTRRKAKPASQIKLSNPKKLTTGRQAWDSALDGGLVRPSSVLLFGQAGVGKSTRSLAIALHFAEKYRVLYGSAEMSEELFSQMLNRVCDAVKPSDKALANLHVNESDDVEQLLEDVTDLKPIFVVVDSIQRYRYEGQIGELALRNVVLNVLNSGKEHRHITFLISQVTKEENFIGSNSIRHDVDVEINLVNSSKGVTVQVLDKNRFGRTPRAAIDHDL